jgi:hypothetical protein
VQKGDFAVIEEYYFVSGAVQRGVSGKRQCQELLTKFLKKVLTSAQACGINNT